MEMRIIIETVPHAEQRYDTVGDWYPKRTLEFDPATDQAIPHEVLVVKVSEMKDWKHEALVAMHELVEAILCYDQGIAPTEVDDFDMSGPGAGESDPGDHPNAPYRNAHCFATAVERMLCAAMGVSWAEYERAVEEVGK
jgi:hypothetical protein